MAKGHSEDRYSGRMLLIWSWWLQTYRGPDETHARSGLHCAASIEGREVGITSLLATRLNGQGREDLGSGFPPRSENGYRDLDRVAKEVQVAGREPGALEALDRFGLLNVGVAHLGYEIRTS